jgi:4-hydroxy-tetrahydrodipicolinate synthase
MRGVWTALITPFTEDRKLDLNSYRKILRDQVEAGVAGVIPCGTTGESPTLSVEEKKTLILTALSELKGTNVQVVAGTGTNDTQETIELSRWADQQGVHGVLVVTPYYNKPSQFGLEAHYRAIAESISCEVIAYNVPGRTGVSLTPETISKLATHPRIRTLKEATGNVAFTSEIIDLLSLKNVHLDILSGDDATYLPLLGIGAVGVISVASNLFPGPMVQLQRATETGKWEEARKIHVQYYPLFRDLFVESNPVPIKYAMAYAGWCNPQVRPPLAALTESNLQKLEASLIRCGITRKAIP